MPSTLLTTAQIPIEPPCGVDRCYRLILHRVGILAATRQRPRSLPPVHPLSLADIPAKIARRVGQFDRFGGFALRWPGGRAHTLITDHLTLDIRSALAAVLDWTERFTLPDDVLELVPAARAVVLPPLLEEALR